MVNVVELSSVQEYSGKLDKTTNKMLQCKRMNQTVFLKVLLMSVMCPQLQNVLNPRQSLWKRDTENVEIGDENY